MTEQEWLTATDPAPMLEYLRGKASARKLRLFACACCGRIWDKLADDRSRNAIAIAESFADGGADEDELIAAKESAGSVFLREGGTGLLLSSADHAIAAAFNTCCPPAYLSNAADRAAASLGPRKVDEQREQCAVVREIVGPLPFRPVACSPSWHTATALALAEGIYADRAFDRLPILADALEDAGCDQSDILTHLRSDGPHVLGCWALDLVLGKG